jgi:Predicted nucleic-acid-binding protein implicated in transcription termination
VAKDPKRKLKFHRQCVVCREIMHKDNLIRVARLKSGEISLEAADGRGAYVCKNEKCIEQCVGKRALNRAFRGPISDEIYKQIREK